MNILHIKYAAEVANTGSINMASERLLVVPSNLSRSIKELEDSLGVTLFKRSRRGMTLTPEGSVPRASYIAEAFARFSANINASPAEIYYEETNSLRAMANILEADYQLGIIRYEVSQDGYFKELFQEKGLAFKGIVDFHCVLIMNSKSILANGKGIHLADLRPLIEITHVDPFIPAPSEGEKPEEIGTNGVERRIFVLERGSQFELLSENPETFMWASPVPDKLLRRYGLAQRECLDNKKVYKDTLIYRKDYTLSELDRKFIAEVHNAKRRFP